MRFSERRVTDVCTQCGETAEFVAFDDPISGVILDSAFGMEFEGGWVCDRCIGPEAAGHSASAMRAYSSGGAA